MRLTSTLDLYPYAVRPTPETFADYYAFGAEYVLEVTEGMGFDAPDLAPVVERAVRAMREGDTGVDREVARSVAAVVLGDAEWFFPFAEWLPPLARLQNKVRCAPLVHALRRVGGRYSERLPDFDPPTYSLPSDVHVDGRPACSLVTGYEERMVLATSILHLEWFRDVAERHGVEVPADLVARTRRESARYFTGRTDELSREVKDFQFWLFQDRHWIRKFEARYGGLFGSGGRTGASPPLERVVEEDLV